MLHDCYTDEQLLALLKINSQLAFTELYQRYWKRMFAVAANKTNDLSLAEELVQDVFTDLWVRRETIEIKGALSHYLATAVKYKVIDARIRRDRKLLHEKNASYHLSIVENSTEQYLHFEELRKKIAAQVADLPEKCRLVYQLSREEGYSHKQIANQLHVTEKTVEYHLTRALKVLRTGLQHFFFLLILVFISIRM